jgi:hypothetical protein
LPSPVSVIEPFVPLQTEGLMKLVEAMFAVGFTTTFVVAASEVQLFTVTVSE